MILSDGSIKKALEEKAIIIDPLPKEEQFSTSALDLRLGKEFYRYKPGLVRQNGVDVTVKFSTFKYARLADEFIEPLHLDANGCLVLRPNDFVLCTTAEWVELPISSKIAARVEGRSTLARLGLTVHITAPTIHAGFGGVITLEIKNVGDIQVALSPGDRVCQLIFELVEGDPQTALSSIFQGQRSALGK